MLGNIRNGIRTSMHTLVCTGLLIGSLMYSASAMAAVGGTPAYRVQSVPFQWIDATTGTRQSTGTVIPIGFDFHYYGATYNTLAIGMGFLTMGTYEPSFGAQTTPVMPYMDGALAGFAPGGGVYTTLDGNAPNRRFTVSWIDASFVQISNICDDVCPTYYFGKASFQVTMYEGSNDIVFRYLDVIASDEASPGYDNHDNGANARVGVAKTGLNEGTLYSVGQPLIANRSALHFFVGAQANLSPIADAGTDLTLNQRDTGTLNGSGSSDTGGTIVKYLWEQDFNAYQPAGPIVSITNADAAIASVTAPLVPYDKTFVLKLTATDNQGAYSVDRMNLLVRNIDINQPPIANAGTDQTVNEGDRVRLVGTGTDPEGYVVTYKWTQIAGPTVRFISPPGDTESYANFDTPAVAADTVLTFQLTVTDLRGATGSDTVNIKILAAPNKPPLAVAPSFSVKQKTNASLDGSKSYDPDGNVVSYQWRQVAGKAVTLKNATSAIAAFTAPSTNTNLPLTFELTVTDNNGATGTSQVVVVVTRR